MAEQRDRPTASPRGRRRGRSLTVAEALEFVRSNGVVLESGSGPVPTLAAFVAGAPIGGSWWAHAAGREIFALTRAVRESPDVLVCRIVGGKVTYVHRRLWPALVCVARDFPRQRLARIRERHSESGRHVVEAEAYPRWISGALSRAARKLDPDAALAALGAWCAR